MKIERFLDKKLENAQSYALWLWIPGINKLKGYLDKNNNLDEITMQGEFNEEIDIIKEWIKEWKEMNNEKR